MDFCMRLIMATNNPHKIEEVRQILADWPGEILCLAQFPEIPDPPEDQDTFAGNALQKARFVYERVGNIVIADDSGLEVDALDGAPGVWSKRYTEQATAQSNNAKLLRELGEEQNRTARFRCAMAIIWADGEQVVEGSCEGRISMQPTGTGGFGYDPLFIPEEHPHQSMAELSSEEKNAISHRGKAFQQLPTLLMNLGLLMPSATN